MKHFFIIIIFSVAVLGAMDNSSENLIAKPEWVSNLEEILQQTRSLLEAQSPLFGVETALVTLQQNMQIIIERQNLLEALIFNVAITGNNTEKDLRAPVTFLIKTQSEEQIRIGNLEQRIKALEVHLVNHCHFHLDNNNNVLRCTDRAVPYPYQPGMDFNR